MKENYIFIHYECLRKISALYKIEKWVKFNYPQTPGQGKVNRTLLNLFFFFRKLLLLFLKDENCLNALEKIKSKTPTFVKAISKFQIACMIYFVSKNYILNHIFFFYGKQRFYNIEINCYCFFFFTQVTHFLLELSGYGFSFYF